MTFDDQVPDGHEQPDIVTEQYKPIGKSGLDNILELIASQKQQNETDGNFPGGA